MSILLVSYFAQKGLCDKPCIRRIRPFLSPVEYTLIITTYPGLAPSARLMCFAIKDFKVRIGRTHYSLPDIVEAVPDMTGGHSRPCLVEEVIGGSNVSLQVRGVER